MNNILYTKETFIYENSNSISDEICNDIIEIYENEKIESEVYNMDISVKYKNIKKYLTFELEKSIHNYNKKFNLFSQYKLLNFENIFDKNITFFIKKNNKNEVNITNRCSEKKIKILMFIWFLNDYEGGYVFCNEYNIKPKTGKLIIFPVSWCFPYHELISLETQKYIIYGYIYA